MRDPGLQSGAYSNTVNLNLPNVNRLSQADATLLANTVMQEIQRRGNTVFY
jgi:hypothetical protein